MKKDGLWGHEPAIVRATLYHSTSGAAEALAIYQDKNNPTILVIRRRSKYDKVADRYVEIDNLEMIGFRSFSVYVSHAPLVEEERDDKTGEKLYAEGVPGLLCLSIIPRNARAEPEKWVEIEPDYEEPIGTVGEDGVPPVAEPPSSRAKRVFARRADRRIAEWRERRKGGTST